HVLAGRIGRLGDDLFRGGVGNRVGLSRLRFDPSTVHVHAVRSRPIVLAFRRLSHRAFPRVETNFLYTSAAEKASRPETTFRAPTARARSRRTAPRRRTRARPSRTLPPCSPPEPGP